MNILVIRTHRLGDILQLTPMLEGLKEEYPEGKISFMIGKDFTELLEGNPDVDEIIPIPENEYRYWLKNKPERYPAIFNEIYDMVCELKQRDFRIVVNRQYEWGAMFAHLIGAERVLGGSYSPEKGFYFGDRTSRELFYLIRNDRRANRRNLVDWACCVAGVSPDKTRQMIFRVSRTARQEAEELLMDQGWKGDKYPVGVQLGAARSFRQWGSENFAEIVDWLIKEKDKSVVLIGSEDEKDLGMQMDRTFEQHENGLIDLIGKTSLGTLGAVLEKCECLITGDTGSMHVAAAVGTPVLALFFGTAYPWETGPYGPGHFILYTDIPCAPCLDPTQCQEGHRCKKEMTPDVVMKAFGAADAFRKNEPVQWEPASDRIKLFITAKGKEGEQTLLPVKDGNGLLVQSPQRNLNKNGMETPHLETILTKGDKVIRSFLKGEAEKGFLNFKQYLNYWLEAKYAITGEHPGMRERLSELLKECLGAMHDKDLVTLMDNIEYGFKPLLERSLISCRDKRIGTCHPHSPL